MIERRVDMPERGHAPVVLMVCPLTAVNAARSLFMRRVKTEYRSYVASAAGHGSNTIPVVLVLGCDHFFDTTAAIIANLERPAELLSGVGASEPPSMLRDPERAMDSRRWLRKVGRTSSGALRARSCRSGMRLRIRARREGRSEPAAGSANPALLMTHVHDRPYAHTSSSGASTFVAARRSTAKDRAARACAA